MTEALIVGAIGGGSLWFLIIAGCIVWPEIKPTKKSQ